MSRCIILPDLHLRCKQADAILEYEKPYDKVIWINDLFDQFDDNAEQNRNAAIWLKDKLADDRNIFLWSNHVQSYAYSYNPNMFCSGFTHEKSLRIWEILNRDDFNKMKLYHVEDGILFTHAGLSNALVKLHNGDTIETIEEVSKFLDFHYERAKLALETGNNHWLFAAGRDRGGDEKIGGVTWCDFGSFVNTPFVQIYGHSPIKEPVFMTTNSKGGVSKFVARDAQEQDFKDKFGYGGRKRTSLNLDTHLHDYAILENGELTIKKVIWISYWPVVDQGNFEIKTTIRLFKGKIV
jgi:hypothetical protein